MLILFSDDLDSDLGFDVLVDVNLSGESADLFEFCTIHNNLLAVDVVVVLLLQGLSNLVAGDGAEKVAVLTDLGDKADALLVDSSLQGFGIIAEFLLFERFSA